MHSPFKVLLRLFVSEGTSNDRPQGPLCGQGDRVGCRNAKGGSSVKGEMCEEFEKGDVV